MQIFRAGLVAALFASLFACQPPEPTEAPPPDDTGSVPQPLSSTWAQDVAPILSEQCSACHVAGGIAPFALTSYAEAAPRAMAIKAAVEAKRMPPWMPGGQTPQLRHERKLTPEQIALLARWADDGAPLGDTTHPAAIGPPQDPTFTDPDLTFDTGADYAPNSNFTDDYRCFVVPLGQSSTEMAAAYRVTPGNRKTVHHVILALYSADSLPELQRLDDADPGPGYTCFGGTSAGSTNVTQVGALGGWVPGSSTVEFVPGTAVRLPQGSVAVVQIHYNLAGGTDPDRTRVEVKYAAPGTNPQAASTLPLRRAALNIPPGSKGHLEESTAPAKTWALGRFYPDGDGYLVGVAGHMHTLGTRIEITRTNLSGTQTLLDIPAWDFHWQGFYQLVTPIQLAPTDLLTVRCTYDNPGASAVTWGEGTSDEMCIGYLQVVDNAPAN